MALDEPMRAFAVFSNYQDIQAAIAELKATDFRI